MSGKSLVWGGMIIGSTIGGFLPYVWNGGPFLYAVCGGAFGGLLGIWIGFKLAKATGAL